MPPPRTYERARGEGWDPVPFPRDLIPHDHAPAAQIFKMAIESKTMTLDDIQNYVKGTFWTRVRCVSLDNNKERYFVQMGINTEGGYLMRIGKSESFEDLYNHLRRTHKKKPGIGIQIYSIANIQGTDGIVSHSQLRLGPGNIRERFEKAYIESQEAGYQHVLEIEFY